MSTQITKQEAAALYAAVFNRAPDAAGLKFWTTDTEDNFQQMANSFTNHPVFANTYGDKENEAFVTAIYENVLLGSGDAEGIAFWTAALDNGMSRGDFIAEFIGASLNYESDPEFEGNEAALLRKAAIVNRADVGVEYADTLGKFSAIDPNNEPIEDQQAYKDSVAAIAGVTSDPATVVAAQAIIAQQLANAQVGDTLTLTTGVDNLVGTDNNDTFDAPLGTLQTADRIDGGEGNNTLNAQLNSGFVFKNVIKNIQNVSVLAAEGGTLSEDGILNADMTTVKGLKSLTSLDSQVKLAFLNVGNEVELNVVGGEKTNTILNYKENTANNALTEQTINLNNADAANITVQIRGTDFSPTEIKTLNLNVEGDNSITRAGVYDEAPITGSIAETINVTGAGNLTWKILDGDVTKFDASKSTGDITIGKVTNTAQIESIDLGAGYNTIGVADVDGDFSAFLAKTKGVSALQTAKWTGGGDNAIDLGKFEGVTFENVGADGATVENFNVETTSNAFSVNVGEVAGEEGLTFTTASFSKNVSTLALADVSEDGAAEVSITLAAAVKDGVNSGLKTIDLSGLGADAEVTLDASALNEAGFGKALTINVGDVGTADIELGAGTRDTFKFTGEEIGDIEIAGFETGINVDKLDFSAFEGVNSFRDLSIVRTEADGVSTITITANADQFEGTITLVGVGDNITANNFAEESLVF